jgi:hypothetical protein
LLLAGDDECSRGDGDLHDSPEGKIMRKGMPSQEIGETDEDLLNSATTLAALLLLAEKFPHRQFNSAELALISGIGRTAMSQIKNAPDTPFSLGKCTMQRLDSWLASHPGWKQE